MHLGYCCKTFCQQKRSKITQSGHTDDDHEEEEESCIPISLSHTHSLSFSLSLSLSLSLYAFDLLTMSVRPSVLYGGMASLKRKIGV